MLAYLDVPHDIPAPSDLETAKNIQHARVPEQDLSEVINETRFKAATEQPAVSVATTVAFSDGDAVIVPDLTGETVRGVTEDCSRLGLVPSLIGSGVALEQSPEAGARVVHGSRVTVRFGRVAAETPSASAQRNVN